VYCSATELKYCSATELKYCRVTVLKYCSLTEPIYSRIQRNYSILYLWFRATLIYINSCPTGWNTKQSIYYSASSFYIFRVSNTGTGGCSYSFVYSRLWVWLTPEICRVNLHNNRLLCVASRWTTISIN